MLSSFGFIGYVWLSMESSGDFFDSSSMQSSII